MNERPGDVRYFVHRRIIGAISGGLTGGIGGAVGGFVGGGSGGGVAPRTITNGRSRPRRGAQFGICPPGRNGLPRVRDALGNCVAVGAASLGGSQTVQTGCPSGMVMGPAGFCVVPGSPVATDLGIGAGVAVMGRYGAGMAPDIMQSTRHDCLPGMVLGTDDICYNRGDIKNSERKWPKGRRPLLTGGDLNAITRASRAARAIQRTEKRLQKLGMLKKPSRRAPAPRSRQLMAPADGVRVVNVE